MTPDPKDKNDLSGAQDQGGKHGEQKGGTDAAARGSSLGQKKQRPERPDHAEE